MLKTIDGKAMNKACGPSWRKMAERLTSQSEQSFKDLIAVYKPNAAVKELGNEHEKDPVVPSNAIPEPRSGSHQHTYCSIQRGNGKRVGYSRRRGNRPISTQSHDLDGYGPIHVTSSLRILDPTTYAMGHQCSDLSSPIPHPQTSLGFTIDEFIGIRDLPFTFTICESTMNSDHSDYFHYS